MRKPLHHSIRQSILWLGLVMASLGYAHAGGNEDTKPKDNTQPNEGKTTVSQAEALRMQKAMNKALSSLNLDFANVQPEVITQPFMAEDTKAAVGRAMSTFEKVRYLEELSVLNTVLPVGVKETIGNTTVEVAVATLNIYPAYAEVTIYCRLHIKDKNAPNGERDIFFGAQNVKIGSGGLIDGAELALLGDVTIPFGDHSFTLKGGFDEKTGATNSLTYVKVGCKGFEYVSVNGLMKFSRNQVLPYDANNRIAKPVGNVEVAVRTIASSLDDIFVTVNVPSFCLKGNEKWGYSVNQATFDFSDIRAVSGGIYPQVAGKAYWDAVGEPSLETWKGIHVRKFEVLFPKEFAKKGKKQVSASADNLVLDKNGISALVNLTIADTQADPSKKPASLEDGRAGKWKMSINSLYLDVVLNKFNGGGLGGDILLPVQNAKNAPASNMNTGDSYTAAPDMFKYSAIIYKGGEVEFSLSSASTIDFKLFGFAKAKIAPGSIVRLTAEGGKIVPYAKLTGSLNITTKIKNSDNDDNQTAENNLDGIVFRELVIQDKAPNVSVQYFGYVKPSHSAAFPISIDEISVRLYNQNTVPTGEIVCGNLVASPKRNYAIIKIGSSVSLDESFGGSAGFNIVGHFDEDEANEESYVEFDCMKLTDMCIKTNFSAFAFQAGLKMYNTGTEKGFEGQVSLMLKKPKEITICAAGRFTKENGKSYWYVNGGAEDKTTGLVTIGSLTINSIAGGLFRRMEQDDDPNATNLSTGLRCVNCTIPGLNKLVYKKTDHVSIGFRAVVGLSGGGKSFKGSAGFEILLNETWGLRSINLFGQGEFAPENVDIPSIGGTELTNAMKGLVDGAADLVTDNPVGKFVSESELVKKAKKCFSKKDAAGETMAEANKVLFNFGFKLDIDKENGNIFHGQAEVFADFGNGKLHGIGKNGRAGWMVMHFEDSKWYIHVGTPQDKIGFALNAGPLKANVGAYFMVGKKIEPFAQLPNQLDAILTAQQKIDLAADKPTSTTDNAALLEAGEGIAFGANLGVSTGDIQALIFYANFDAGLGFDLMMSKNSSSTCNSGNWYAKGRLYAYMQGELGIIVKLLVITKKIPIIKGGAGILLQGGMPSPAWFNGQVAGYYSLLNDKIKGKFNMEVRLGDAPCN